MSLFRRLLPVAVLGLAILAPAGLAEAKTRHTAPSHLVAKSKKASKKKHKKKHKKHTKQATKKTLATKSAKAASPRRA